MVYQDNEVSRVELAAMKRTIFRTAMIVVAVFTVSGVAQTSASGPAQASGATSSSANQNTQTAGETSGGLSGRTALLVELTSSLDAKKAKPGDAVEAKLTQDVKSDGKVVLHRGAKLVGHVCEAKARSKEDPESRLGIVFEKAAGKHSEEFAFRAVVMAVAPSVEESTGIAGDPTRLSSGSTMGGQPFGAGNSVGGPSASAAPSVEAATPGGGAGGVLNASSRGAIGLPGVALRPSAVDGVQGTVMVSGDHNVKLESGTQMLLLVSGAAH
jgi:hypothetical protein